ncbi:hypothetical protein PR048_003393 [Dryococelus australis]|uniref:Uncharacterized protein n=1 Tax=Dryococelus australis TaxID=614101 RepID=A0ABQ9IMY9_9NEOP|nr:hypothetical protein PR048_003393 [Dryococelus australis]
MAARKRSDILVCGTNEAMMCYFEMLTSESSSSEDEMDCDNIRLVAANQSRAVDRQIIVLQSQVKITLLWILVVMLTGGGKSLVELVCHPFTGVSGIAPNLNFDNNPAEQL